MTVRADYDPKYFRRFLLISLGCLAFAGWCFYDALVKYPAELERAEVYWKPSNEKGEKYKAMERTEWRQVVRQNQWPTEAPHKPNKMKHKIQSQYLFAAICGLIGIPCLFKWFLARGSWVNSDGRQLTTSWGPSFQFEQVRSIDKTRWEKKGITRIHYQQDGVDKQFVFDDFKFDRETMSQILTEIETHLSDDQITGGDRETVIKARKAEEKAAVPSAE